MGQGTSKARLHVPLRRVRTQVRSVFSQNVPCRGGILCSLAGIFFTPEVVTFQPNQK